MTPAELNAIDKSADLAKGFLSKILGPSAQEVGLMFADNFKIRRLKNQIKNLEKVRRIVEEENITLKDVNLKVLVPYLDSVSLEEEESLQEKWANLFANYLDAEKVLSSTVYPSILAQLSSTDIEILDYLSKSPGKTINLKPLSNPASERWNFTDVINLLRLGILEEEFDYKTNEIQINHSGYTNNLEIVQVGLDKYYFTIFGQEFYDACNR